MKHHILIIMAIAIGFSTFLLGYSLPPFLEVGFGTGDSPQQATGVSEEELMKQYEDLYKQVEE